MRLLDTTYKQKPLWLDNAHLQPCGDQFEFGKAYRCYWYDNQKPSGYRKSTICECVPGFQMELCFTPKNNSDLNRYMACAFHKIEDLEGNVLLYPPPLQIRCDKCGSVVYAETTVLRKLKHQDGFHTLCRDCNEKFKDQYEKIFRGF